MEDSEFERGKNTVPSKPYLSPSSLLDIYGISILWFLKKDYFIDVRK